jgi:nitroreductase
MELMDVLKNRRAVRDYTDSPLGRPAIERLICAATLAPSAMNRQPWAFAVLLDRQRIDEYADRARKWLLENLAAAGHDEGARDILDQPEYSIFYRAPAIVIVAAQSQASQAAEDCCLAAQNLMLAARDQGIGSCWIGFARPWLNLPSTKEELGIPGKYQVVAPIVLGYPRSWPETHGRKHAEIHWI